MLDMPNKHCSFVLPPNKHAMLRMGAMLIGPKKNLWAKNKNSK